MANQQLIDYVKGQMMANVSEADIRKILKDAGWPDTEIDEGLKGAKGESVQPVQPAASPMVSTAKPVEPAKVEPKKESMSFDFMTNPGGVSSTSSMSPAKGTKDKDKEAKPMAMSSDASPSDNKASKLPWVVAGVAVVVMLGVGVYFYLQNNSLAAQVNTLTTSNSALTSKMQSLQGSTASIDQLNAAQADALEANNELGLFITSSSATGTPVAAAFDFKGTVGMAKSGYTLTLAKGIVLSVQNSKDPKVITALQPLVGTPAELAGMHIPGTFSFTLETLNGAALPAISTSTPSSTTSTLPAGTSVTK